MNLSSSNTYDQNCSNQTLQYWKYITHYLFTQFEKMPRCNSYDTLKTLVGFNDRHIRRTDKYNVANHYSDHKIKYTLNVKYDKKIEAALIDA